MAKNVHRFRRLKSGDPERTFKVLAEDIGSRTSAVPSRRKRGLTIPGALTGLMLVSAFGVGYSMDRLSQDRPRTAVVGSGCNIKGNISIETGERIYHVPGQKYYGQTRVSPEYGERWFCSEVEARNEGWRRSRI